MLLLIAILITCVIAVLGFLLEYILGILVLPITLAIAFVIHKIFINKLNDQAFDNFLILGFWVISAGLIFGILAGFLSQHVRII